MKKNKLKLFHDKEGNTLTIWFDEPFKETVAEEIGQDVVIMKDKQGKIIGFEKLNYSIPNKDLPIEVISA